MKLVACETLAGRLGGQFVRHREMRDAPFSERRWISRLATCSACLICLWVGCQKTGF
jgi:hypothetical protein